MQIKPMRAYVVGKLIKEDNVTKSGIILVESTGRQKTARIEIVSVPDECELKAGMIAIIHGSAAKQLTDGLVLVHQNELLALVV